MERTYIKDLKSKVKESVVIKGFVQVIRDQGKIKFLIVRDVTGVIQVVALDHKSQAFKIIDSLTHESVVSVEGVVSEEKQAPGGYEIKAENIEILSKANPELPIPVMYEKGGEESDVTKRFDWRWIDLRRSERQQIFKVWTELEIGFRDYFLKNNYFQLYSPAFMSSPSESGAEVFEVKYFDKKSYLAQSPQFYKQMAMAAGFERVFMTGPVFRAEPSFTTRHMTEFTGWDFEISYVDSHHEVMDELENAIVMGFERLNKSLNLNLDVPKQPFPRVTLSEAKKLLAKSGVSSERPYDVSPEEEREICQIFKEKNNSDFVFLIDYPIEGRPFYHMRYEDNSKITKSFDLMYKGVEIVTGAQREHRAEILEKQAIDKGMDLDSIEDYLNFFRYGCPPHGGAGIGPGRLIMKILDLPSVKEATFLPRDVKRLRP